jgi:hypothetical protein
MTPVRVLESLDQSWEGGVVHLKRWSARLSFGFFLVVGLLVLLFVLSGAADAGTVPVPQSQPSDDPMVVYLPAVYRYYPWPSPFGIEVSRQSKLSDTILERGEDLGTKWVRLHRVSWREVQPVEGGPYDWSVLSSFEDELRAARSADFTPIVIVQHSPRWATINEPFETDCGAIRADKFGAFADFMRALVQRYKQSEFNVHYWELGNEPDVDPRLVKPDFVFGCWGDIEDPYYGGEHYGEMLKVVSPAIKAVDPSAKVLIGGLLLARPETPDPTLGKPELFFEGILRAGAASYFDIVPYHAYLVYLGENVDYDNGIDWMYWYSWGGWTLGKARFLRQMMAKYGVTKPLFLNETALECHEDWASCNPPEPEFFQAQANYLVRTFTRDLSEDIMGFVWYTLDGPGWWQGGLLDGDDNPRPAYGAYQHLIVRLRNSQFETSVDYGPGIEAYSFTKGNRRVHVVWTEEDVLNTIQVPQSTYLAAYTRDGFLMAPTPVGSNYQFTIAFEPIYIEMQR